MSRSRRGITLEDIKEETENFHMALAISASLAENERNSKQNSKVYGNQNHQIPPPPSTFLYNKPNISNEISFPTALPYEVNNESNLIIPPVIVRQRKPSPPQPQNSPKIEKQSEPRNRKSKSQNNPFWLNCLIGLIFILVISMAILFILAWLPYLSQDSPNENGDVGEKVTLVSAAKNGYATVVRALVDNSTDSEKSDGKGGI